MSPSTVRLDEGGPLGLYPSLLDYLLLIDSERERILVFSYTPSNDPSRLLSNIKVTQMTLVKLNELQNQMA